MKRVREYSLAYLIGALGYTVLEILWRGYTHWSMTITGGACFLGFHIMNRKCRRAPLFKRCLFGCGIITALELIVGCVVNLIFKMKVWDYSGNRFNILGQICLGYSVLWFLLCIPLNKISKAISR